MSLSALTRRIRSHYESRHFSAALIDMLCDEAERRMSNEGLRIAAGRFASVERLIGIFEPIDQSQSPATLEAEPAALIGLAFGYRLDSPFARFPEDRRPGKNNAAIALQLEHCRLLFPTAWIAAQHEVGLALCESGEVKPDLAMPARDYTTVEALSYIIEHLPRIAFGGNRSIVIVSHAHHYGRCALFLSRAGFEPRMPPKEVVPYTGYDEHGAQPRFRSPWEYLLNDFIVQCQSSTSAGTLSPFRARRSQRS